MNDAGTITHLVNRIGRGEPLSRADLFPIVYSELRSLARSRLRSDRNPANLDATELVHGVYLKLFGSSQEKGSDGRIWQSRAHFFGAAARAIEQMLVDAARREAVRQRRLGPRAMIRDPDRPLEPDALAGASRAPVCDVVQFSAALEELELTDRDLADLVRLRIFLNHTTKAIAELRGVSQRSVQRDWSLAEAWLMRRLSSEPHGGTWA